MNLTKELYQLNQQAAKKAPGKFSDLEEKLPEKLYNWIMHYYNLNPQYPIDFPIMTGDQMIPELQIETTLLIALLNSKRDPYERQDIPEISDDEFNQMVSAVLALNADPNLEAGSGPPLYNSDSQTFPLLMAADADLTKRSRLNAATLLDNLLLSRVGHPERTIFSEIMQLDLSLDFPKLQYSAKIPEILTKRFALLPDSLLAVVLEYIYDNYDVAQHNDNLHVFLQKELAAGRDTLKLGQPVFPKAIAELITQYSQTVVPLTRFSGEKLPAEFWQRVRILVPKLKAYRARLAAAAPANAAASSEAASPVLCFSASATQSASLGSSMAQTEVIAAAVAVPPGDQLLAEQPMSQASQKHS